MDANESYETDDNFGGKASEESILNLGKTLGLYFWNWKPKNYIQMGWKPMD